MKNFLRRAHIFELYSFGAWAGFCAHMAARCFVSDGDWFSDIFPALVTSFFTGIGFATTVSLVRDSLD